MNVRKPDRFPPVRKEGEVLVRVVAPHFCAGLLMVEDKVVFAAPILGWTVGRDVGGLRDYFARKGWKATRV